MLEYGDGYFAENPDAQLAKINFVRGNHADRHGHGDAAQRPPAARGPVRTRP